MALSLFTAAAVVAVAAMADPPKRTLVIPVISW